MSFYENSPPKNNFEYFEDDDEENSDYFSCLSDSEFEDEDEDEDDLKNSEFSLTPVHSSTSNISSDNESIISTFKPALKLGVIEQLQTEQSNRADDSICSTTQETKVRHQEDPTATPRSPIDITSFTKLLDKMKPQAAKPSLSNLNTCFAQTELYTNTLPVLPELHINPENSLHTKYNTPIAPIINSTDPFYQINKKYDYELFMHDQLNKFQQLSQNPLVSRFFPLGSQADLPLIGEVNVPVGPTASSNISKVDTNTNFSPRTSSDTSLSFLLGHHRRRLAVHV